MDGMMWGACLRPPAPPLLPYRAFAHPSTEAQRVRHHSLVPLQICVICSEKLIQHFVHCPVNRFHCLQQKDSLEYLYCEKYETGLLLWWQDDSHSDCNGWRAG